MSELDVRIDRGSPASVSTPLLVLLIFERDSDPAGAAAEVDARFGGHVSRALAGNDFRGRRDDTLVLYPTSDEPGPERLLLVGVGKREDFTLESLRRAVGVAVRRAEAMGVVEISLALRSVDALSEHMGSYFAARGAAEAAVLASWSFRDLKTGEDEARPAGPVRTLRILADSDDEADALRRGAEHGEVVARAENRARDLAVRPGNMATPTFLADTALRLGQELGFEVKVLDRDAIFEEGMHALLAVAQGSAEPPRFIVMEYHGGEKGEAPLVLVGKGVTFDAGGISIKPADKMEEMKYDMGGAAAVIAALSGIAELELPVNVVGLVPSAENLPSGSAVKPGDVIASHAGKTIEVINTDAEGRLLLADALSYARRYEPAAVVDAATLTGAVIVALGHHAIGLMGNDGGLMDELRAAGQRVGERCWPLPLWDEYRRQLDSDVADIRNTGGRPAGSLTAGWFLKEFAGPGPWAHLDVAGTAWRDDPDPPLRKGPTGVPTRLFIEWVRARAER